MYGYIYLTTNLINNKIYVGQHKAKKFSDKYLGSGVNIRKAINKYGKQSFKVQLLEWCETQDIADNKELYYIDKFNSRDITIGYNITIGGQKRFFTGQTHTDESKQKMSERAKNRPHPPTTKGRICYTNGKDNKLLTSDKFEEYENLGWWKGKTCEKRIPWNKGLTKDSDERISKMSQERLERFKNGESIGCFGVKGNTNGFKKGGIPWNKDLKGYNNGHPNYYLGKSKNK